ncbi:FtsK/SpoIIIE domain-containing protein, partial [Sinomonas sp.]|uniref:FtsK/SpoIIIE domain-containing protein n=1 Tax=Sinomonas sp. TaxID=1914986 RepID=UPI002FE10712
ISRSEGDERERPGRIGLPDPELSRRHAELHVTDTVVRLVDCGSSNGTWLGNLRVRETTLEAGQEFRVGASVCSLEFEGESTLDPRGGSQHGESLRVVRRIPPQRTTTMLALGLAPLAMGLALALFFGQWMFLAFSTMSLISLALPLAEGEKERRVFKRGLADAVEQDLVRRVAAAPDAAQLCLASEAVSDVPEGAPEDGPVFVRLGTARLPADLAVEPPLPSPPHHARAPLVVGVEGTVRLEGRVTEVEGLVRFLLLQLAVLPAAQRVRVHLVGGSDRLRLAARFLPGVRILRDGDAGTEAARSLVLGDGRDVAILLPGAPEASTHVFAQESRRHGAWVVDGTGVLSSHDTLVHVGESSGLLTSRRLRSEFIPDLLGSVPFERAARARAARARAARARAARGTSLRRSSSGGTPTTGGPLPDACGLDLLVGLTRAELIETWSARSPRKGCWLPLGVAESGPLGIDLVSGSPHVLVAGTTGAGKSELLRTMIAGGAARHSPDQLTFLLIDFKGGAGLAPLEGLPHCVGLVTDLSGGLSRVLVSLRSEVVRRERLLAEGGCDDIDVYAARNETEPLPRLALVVDEFRVLVDEEPESLRELLRIASVGRSLGIHLIMATQRPHGAISADIRANVGCAIALRVSGAAESRDIIGSDLAARVSTALPGRGYVALGGSDPLEFQTASLRLARNPRLNAELESAAEWLRGTARPAAQPEDSDPSTGLFVQAAQSAWGSLGGTPARRPVAAPLPDDAGPAPIGGRRVLLGVADLPQEQRLAALRWVPEAQGHLALIAGRSTVAGPVLASIASQLGDGLRPRHLYILDADVCLSHLEHHVRTGAYARLDDLGHAARVIAGLSEAAARSCSPKGAPESTQPSLFLIISGWSRWVSAFRHGPYSKTEGQLNDLVRNDRSSGLVLLVAGEGDLVGSRIFGEFRCRLFLPHGTPDDARLGWPRLPHGPAGPSRGIGPSRGAGPSRGIATGLLEYEEPVLVQCFSAPARSPRSFPAPDPNLRPALRVLPLPTAVTAAQVAEATLRSAALGECRQGEQGRLVAIGLHGDRHDPLSVPLGPRGLLLVLGSPGSGKSCFLEALPAMNPTLGPWFAGSGEGALHDALAAARAGEAPILLIDDADGLGAKGGETIRLALDEGVSVIATAGYGGPMFGRLPFAVARPSTTGIALGPRSPGDGDAFGVRFNPLEQFVPGRAIAVVGGRQTEVQLGWLAPAASGRRVLSPGGSRGQAAA